MSTTAIWQLTYVAGLENVNIVVLLFKYATIMTFISKIFSDLPVTEIYFSLFSNIFLTVFRNVCNPAEHILKSPHTFVYNNLGMDEPIFIKCYIGALYEKLLAISVFI